MHGISALAHVLPPDYLPEISISSDLYTILSDSWYLNLNNNGILVTSNSLDSFSDFYEDFDYLLSLLENNINNDQIFLNGKYYNPNKFKLLIIDIFKEFEKFSIDVKLNVRKGVFYGEKLIYDNTITVCDDYKKVNAIHLTVENFRDRVYKL